MLSEQELERYARHIARRDVGGFGQAAVKRACIIFVFVGWLGALVLM